ncbi:DUF4097 family beta strand repeat-containing protein [Streptomyces reniochalinae]|uniref:DUF4097 domain-containing protein n=1 Tax=Streptomyces reniochalinae TaxID=2250578 RepID=A0A367E9Y9_9ACTN|nr:DUF4097 family beta strand repeat-containing protein [Streptomyces reniochalinae]RCG14177.1 hypothetical protein DQ392_29050 [Streptomyces reniochalinae]
MTQRTFEMSSTGPIVLGLDLPVGSAEVQVSHNVTRARVMLRTEDESGPAANAILRAREWEDGQTLAVEVPDLPGGTVTQSVRGNHVVQHAGTVSGTVTGMTIINGQVITGGGMTCTVSPIVARIVLPAGSSLAMVSQSADLAAYGPLERAEFRSVSGSCRFDAVREVIASTTSGDIIAGPVTDSITARSISGDIETDPYAGGNADLTTTSGDVRVYAMAAASGRLRAHTVSGDVRVSGGRHLDLSVRSVSGRTRT